MTPKLSVRGFLVARFIAMLAWVLLLVLGYLRDRALAPHLSTDWARWLLNLATVAASVALCLALQRRALHWLDPEGDLRPQVRQASERDLR
jgi:membrane protein DedA with SNARE-associated domain